MLLNVPRPFDMLPGFPQADSTVGDGNFQESNLHTKNSFQKINDLSNEHCLLTVCRFEMYSRLYQVVCDVTAGAWEKKF